MAVAAGLAFVMKMAAVQITSAAATSLIETGSAVTQNALMNKFREWGVDTDNDSFMGQFMENFQDNLGAGLQMAVMTQSMAITNSLVEPLEDKMNADMQTVKNNLESAINDQKNKVAKSKFKYFKQKKLNTLYDAKQKNVENTTRVMNTGTNFANAYSTGSTGMEQGYNSKQLHNVNPQGLDPEELVKIVNQLLVAQKVG